MAQTAPIGETIATSTTELLVESRTLHEAPPVGSVVVVGELLGVVIRAETGPIDPTRRTVALGYSGTELDAAHPELASLLRTTFAVRPVATISGAAPSVLASLHAPVALASEEVRAALATRFEYLHRLADVPVDVLAEHLRHMSPDRPTRARAAEGIVRALAHDPHALALVLRSLEVTP